MPSIPAAQQAGYNSKRFCVKVILLSCRRAARYCRGHICQTNQYQFCFGPWNISEGQDPYGPTTRPAQTFDWKLGQLKKLGFDAMMFHDDDAVPDIDGKSDAQLRKESEGTRRRSWTTPASRPRWSLRGFGSAR